MVQIILTKQDLKYSSKNKSITTIKLKDFDKLFVSQLSIATSIVYIDEITKQSHSLR